MKQKKTEEKSTIEQEQFDEIYMERALLLAQKAYPAPNPQVGAVLVRDGKIIGEGYHTKAGESHAEINALKDAEKRKILPDGATLYVTLEPCCHLGKTSPCVDALVVEGIKRVVIGCIDQNYLVNGEGIMALLHAGISVNIGILGKKCSALYKHFFHVQKYKRSYVTLKSAITLDAKISITPEKQTVISSLESRYRSHELRKEHDAVLVGIGTVLADNPQLSCRIHCNRQPTPVILDSFLRISPEARVLQNQKTIIATTYYADKKKLSLLKKNGYRIIITNGKKVDIVALLRQLPNYGILSVLVEGGAHVNASFLEDNAVDHFCLFIAPKLFGKGVPLFKATKVFRKNGIALKNVVYRQTGTDICVEGDV